MIAPDLRALGLPVTDQSHDLPLDAHVHTDLSPDSAVPIDVYAALAVELGIAELAITDHVDFDPRDPAYEYTSFEDRERTVRQAAERWVDRGVAIRFGVELTYHSSWEADVRDHLARHRYDFTIGSVHDWPGSPYTPGQVGRWAAGRPLDEVVAPYLDQVRSAARTGLFDSIGHLDVVKRFLHPHVLPADLAARPELFEPILQALVESGTALEVNTSGLRHPVRETYPPAPIVERYRELGGQRVTAGSDAHRSEWLSWGLEEGYRILAQADFAELTFRRGGAPVSIALPTRFGPG
ncbi:MAG: histidinol-phosphatase [Chloroflexota bacterium]|nr:histidinol-phosphatase [Chloroflexota bacterium]